MKNIRRLTKTRNVLRSSIAKKFGQFESLENRLVMANDFLAGMAFIDANNNGQMDFEERYLPEATIELRSADGSTLYDTCVTDDQGAYLFSNVTPGNYKLVNRSAPDYASSNAQWLSDISSVTGSTVNSINVTLRPPTDLTASVDMDRFINEINAFENVTVSIGSYSVTKNIGQLPSTLQGNTLNPNPSSEILTLSVDLFNGLGTGLNSPYNVDASHNPVGSGMPHNGQRVAYLYNHYGREQLNSTDAAGLQLAVWELLYDADSLDPDGDLNTGNFTVINASQDSILAAQFYLTDSLDRNEAAIFLNVTTQPSAPTTNRTQSLIAGGSFNFANVTAAKIGDFVWHDKNASGRFELGELPIAGATVNLYQNSSLIATQTTNSQGKYLFDHLLAGTYKVEFVFPSGFTQASAANVAADDIDSDGPLTGNIVLAAGQTNDTVDQGFYKLASLGDFVWDDKNGNGTQNANEDGIANAQVNLLRGGTLVDSKTTDSNGRYLFENLQPGVYDVQFVTPTGYGYISPQGSEAGQFDSDGPLAEAVNLESGENERNIDQGYYGTGTIGNFVFHDVDADGIQDPTEVGINGVTVELLRGPTVVATTQTTGGGLYSFVVSPGTYTVRFTKPAGYSNVSPTDATNDTQDSDGLVTAPVTVVTDGVYNNFDIGFYNLATIGNYVWHDLNADGIQDQTESGIEGATVHLMQGSTEIGTATTAGGGWYSFSPAPGDYTIKFDIPVGYTASSPVDATSDDLDSDGPNVSVTVLSGENNTTIDQGFYNLATIGNLVWNDLDADGIRDNGEPGIDGVAVALMQGTAQVTTAITAGGGLYSFDVVPGTYTVKFTQPAGFNSVSPANATSDDLDSDGLITAAVTVVSGQTNNTVDQGFYNLAASDVCTTIDMQGNTAVAGTYGNVRTFSAGGVSVNASAFSRTTTGSWSTAYLGSYGGGLGVTDSSEDGSGNTHTVDNTGHLNYVLFEFSHQVLVDAAYLGYVVTDSDLTVWIGNVSNAFTSHQTLSDAFLTSLGFTEVNTTTLTSARTADINAGGVRGNILVIAAQVDDTSPEDNFKIANLSVCVQAATGSASIGDFVWHDVNGNGIQDGSAETGIAGATVTLVGGGADGLINGVGDTTTTTTTDSYGKYNFANLVAGTQYKVIFSLPSGYDAATARKTGTNTALNSDGLTSDIIVLASGENNTSIDAGFIKYVKVGNYVWNDLDQDGLQEYGEVGIAGVQLTLTGTSGSGAAISQSTTTATNGSYQFATLPPGTYTVSIAASNFTAGGALAAFTASPINVGTDRGVDSNIQASATSPATLTSGGSDWTVDFGYYTTTTLVCVTMKMEGNTATYGTAGNIRTFSSGGISVKASAFARDSWGYWSTAYLGSYGGGLGVTDNSEGTGGNGTHTLDNVGRRNYILFEFSQVVTIDSAFLGYVINDSDLTAWIGTVTDPFNSHRNLSDSYLNGLGYTETNNTTLTTTRTADLNATNRAGNVLVIAASTGSQDDWFKLAELTLCGTVPTSTAGTKFFVVDDDTDKTFKYTSSVQYTSNFVVGPTSPTGIAANPTGTNSWVSDLSGKVYKYDNNGVLNSSWSTGIASTQGVSTNGTSVWTVSNSTDRVYFYSGAASFTPTTTNPNPTLTSSFALHTSNTNPKDLATDGTYVWVIDDSAVDLLYKYTVSGTYLGRWQIDSANSKPTGITIDPSGGSKIWIVDNGTDRVYEYSGATGCLSGGLLAAKSYALHTGLGNTNPQGIADPPTVDGNSTISDEALAASLLVDGSFINLDVNPYYNVFSATDVNDDGLTTAIDALTIINRLNSGTAGKLSHDAVANGERLDFADVNNDGSVSPLDALLVINQLNQGTPGAVQPAVEPAIVDPSDGTPSAADQVFADLGSGEGEMSSTFLFDSDFTGPRRKR